MLMYLKRRWTDEFASTNSDPTSHDAGDAEHRRSTNWARRFARALSYRWRLAIDAPPIERALEIEREKAYAEQHRLAEEYAQGYLEGWHECYAACLGAVEEEVSRTSDIWAAGELLARTGGSLKTN
jgi:hypothetical protein